MLSGKSGFSAIELSDQTKLSILTVWLQRQDQWKLLARQAAKL